ncbi:MAG: Na/Pi cotransporter family protein [Saprospiraceae bacterium]|nr:Na/Pi cotransporter family protein [Saprospiraceae bacterium]
MKGFDFWQFAAGVAIFIYAMSLIEDSLKHLAARSFKRFLQKQAKSKFKITVASTAITAVLQSSSVVILLVLSFVGAGLIPLKAALAATLGSNLGTTMTSWLIATIGFKINFSSFSFPLLGLSLLGLLFFKKKTNVAQFTNLLIGIAMLFIALEWLKTSANQSLEIYLSEFSRWNYLFFIGIGFVFTGIVQSSSLTMAVALSALYNQILPLESAAATVVGSELGTSLKFLLASRTGLVDKKRLAWGNFILNFCTIIIAASFLFPMLDFISGKLLVRDPLTQLVIFQSGINLISLIIFYPLLGLFSNLLVRFIKDRPSEYIAKFIGNSFSVLPAQALESSQKEIFHLLELTLDLNKSTLGITNDADNGFVGNLRQMASGEQVRFEEKYNKLKFLQGEIHEFLSEIRRDQMNEREILKLGKILIVARLILRSAKNMKDIRHNLLEFEFSANAVVSRNYNEIKTMEMEFYKKYNLLLNSAFHNNEADLVLMLNQNKSGYEERISSLTHELINNEISEMESSNFLNVYREIYSSNKALIQVIAEISTLKSMEAEELN